MAYRRKTTPRKTAPVRRRRRRMGARVTAASTKAAVTIAVKGAVGGAAAAVLTNTVPRAICTCKVTKPQAWPVRVSTPATTPWPVTKFLGCNFSLTF
jgi:hypothetical protein